MVYKTIGIMSGSSLDGLDMAYVHFHEAAGEWTYEIIACECYPYSGDWINNLKAATQMSALDYQLLHSSYGHYVGEKVNVFIDKYNLHHNIHLVASHGHTSFHLPSKKMTAQLGDGAAIAAETRLPVISDLRAMDVAFGGQGAPIVPIGEKLLFPSYQLFLNLGGIANLSVKMHNSYIAFDVCAANRVMNMLANKEGKEFDEDGSLASAGTVSNALLEELNSVEYYRQSYPKSLSNAFGTEIIYPIIEKHGLSVKDALRTYTEHVCYEVKSSIESTAFRQSETAEPKLLVTGGGALNVFLMSRLKQVLHETGIDMIIPDRTLIDYKEAVIMALLGLLRWREQYNVLSSVTGSKRDSIGGALWLGTEA